MCVCICVLMGMDILAVAPLLVHTYKMYVLAGLMIVSVCYDRLCCGMIGNLLLVCVMRYANMCHAMVCNASDWTLTLT